MSFPSIGDMSRAYQTRQSTFSTTKRLAQLTQELSSGRKSDIAANTGGDLTRLNALQSRLTKIDGIKSASSEAAAIASAMQAALETTQSQAQTLGTQMLSLAAPLDTETFHSVFSHASQHFSSAVSALNTAVGGRYIFGGIETSQPPLTSSDEMIASLRSALVGANTISDVTSALDQWFEDPIASPGFFESAYSGSDSRLTPMLLDGGEVITLQPTAASDGIRTTLKGLALGALIADGTLEMDPNMQSALTRQTGLWLSEGANQMIQMRTQLGQIEETIARTATSVESERAVITIAINDMTSADPYETAARVTETENQMQLLYALTARLSRLTLADYLR